MGTINIEACYEKYSPMIFRRCLGILKNEDDALDAAQDVFVKLLHHRQRLHDQFLSSLLYTIATNTCLNRLRKQRRTSSQDTLDLSLAVNDREFERVEAGMLIDAILRSESESTRAICFMYHVDGMTLREIRKLTGLSISGVRKRLLAFKTRVKLKWEPAADLQSSEGSRPVGGQL